MTQRELPTIEIMGTAFIVDVEKGEFREYGNERNSFSFYHINYEGPHYEMAYNENLRNPFMAHPRKCVVRIPQLIQIDPEGMAARYNLSVKALEGKTDFDLMVDQEMYLKRVIRDELPVIDIDGDRFLVDLRFIELRLATDYSKRIVLWDYFDDSTGKYSFYYKQSSKQAININPNITRLPIGVVKVVLPEDHILDPVAAARIDRLGKPKEVGIHEIKDYLMKVPFQKELKARIIPLNETELVGMIKNNKETRQLNNREPLLKKNFERKDKGKHL